MCLSCELMRCMNEYLSSTCYGDERKDLCMYVFCIRFKENRESSQIECAKVKQVRAFD
jgi:hypothetical protein